MTGKWEKMIVMANLFLGLDCRKYKSKIQGISLSCIWGAIAWAIAPAGLQ
jgi:hypothetical protein